MKIGKEITQDITPIINGLHNDSIEIINICVCDKVFGLIVENIHNPIIIGMNLNIQYGNR
jgi:hypothetical protein